MRQSGILAAAGLYALEHNVERLADDHSRAIALGNGLVSLGFQVDPIQTNMVYVDCSECDVEAKRRRLLTRSVRITSSKRLRLVTHLGISDHDIAHVLEAFADSI